MKTFEQLSLLKVLPIALVLLTSNVFAQKIDEEQQRKKLEDIAKEAVQEQFTQLRSTIKTSANPYKVSIDVITLDNIEGKVKALIEGKKEGIKRIIIQTAIDIEQNRTATIKFDGSQLEKEGEELTQAMKNANVSVRSMALSIQMVVDLGKMLYDKAIAERDPKLKTHLYIEYTAFAYELSSIAIELLQNLQLEGVEDVKRIYNNRKQIIEQKKGRVKNKIEQYQRSYSDGKITKEEFDRQVKKYNEWIKSYDITLEVWKPILDYISNQKDWTEKMRGKIADLKEVRDDAGLQLDLLEEVEIARETIDILKSIENIIKIADIPLLPITPDLIKDLLRTEEIEKQINIQQKKD